LPVGLALLPVGSILWGRLRRTTDRETRWDGHTVGAYLVILLASFVMSLGPFLVVNNTVTDLPLPYLAAFHLVPAFSALRAPARFALFIPLSLALLGGLGVQLLVRAVFGGRRGGGWSRIRAVSAAALAVGVVTFLAIECRFTPLPLDFI